MSRLKRGVRRADTAHMAPRLQEAASDESGFSIIEMVVAMTVAALMLMGGAHVLGSSLKTVVFTRSNSQAAELISERIEQLRTSDYAAVAMVAGTAAFTSDSAIGGTALAPTFDPDGAEPALGAENVVTASTGLVNPHITTVTRNDQAYSLATYITRPVDGVEAQATYKRVTVRATWTTGGLTHTRQASTFITITRRGLPLPNFQVIATNVTSPIVVNAGAPLTLPFKVVNRGARDAFNLTLSSSPSLAMSFDLWHDTNADGVGDTAASDTDTNGTPDTGQISSDQTSPMVAVGNVPGTAVAGSYTVTVTATSVGQPSASSATKSATFKVTVVNDGQCSQCTYTPLYLRNEYPACATAPCNSTAKTNMPLRTEAPTAASLPNFDTDVDAFEGRAVAIAAATPGATSTTSSTMGNWRYLMEQSTTINGNLLIDLYVAVPTAGTWPDESVRLKTYVNRSTTGSGATELIASRTHTLPTLSSGFQSIRISVPVSSTTIANNRFLEIKIVLDVEDPLPTTNAISLAYDTSGYPAVVWMPVA